MIAKLINLCLLCLMITGLSTPALSDDLTKMKGYFDFDRLNIPDEITATNEVDIGPELMQAALGISTEDEPGLAELLQGISGVRVRNYEVSADQAAALRPDIEGMAEELIKKGWTRIIRTSSDDEFINVSIRFHDGNMVGMVVLAAEEDEITLVNLVGNLNLATLIQTMQSGEFDFSALDSLQQVMEEAQRNE